MNGFAVYRLSSSDGAADPPFGCNREKVWITDPADSCATIPELPYRVERNRRRTPPRRPIPHKKELTVLGSGTAAGSSSNPGQLSMQ